MAAKTVSGAKVQMRRDTASTWATKNPVLAAGEIGIETDTKRVKVGDGTTTWNNLAYLDAKLVQKSSSRSVEFIKTTNSAAGAALTGVTEDAALYDGKTIFLYLSYAAAAGATLNLTLAGGTTTGAKTIYYTGTSQMGTHYGAGSVISLTYVSAKNAWCRAEYDSNNYDRRRHNNAIKAVSAITNGKIIVGDKNGYKNVASGVTFDVAYPLLRASEDIAAGATSTNTYECLPGVTLRTTVSGWTGTQYSVVYLVGTLSGTTFTIDSTVFTTTVPTTADGKVYIPIGVLYSTYQVFFAPTKEMYAFKAGAFRPLLETSNVSVSINNPGTEVWIEVPMEHLIVGSDTPTDTNALWMEVMT